MARYADLHMHTPASDGTNTLEERVQQAKKHDLDAIAITDHDSINSGLNERAVERDGIEVITGAEIKAEIEGTRIEILSLFLDPEDERLQQLIEKNKRFRLERMQEMVEKLNDLFDADLSFESVKQRSNGNPGRPHLAEELVEKGVAQDQDQAFNEFIGRDCPAYIPLSKVSAEEVIKTVHSNGGATSLAHPGRDLKKDEAGEIIGKLAEMGLDALEVEYTYRHKIQDGYEVNFTEVFASRLAKDHNLLVTGGSDCHGEDTNKHNIGKIKLPYSRVERLKSRSEKYR